MTIYHRYLSVTPERLDAPSALRSIVRGLDIDTTDGAGLLLLVTNSGRRATTFVPAAWRPTLDSLPEPHGKALDRFLRTQPFAPTTVLPFFYGWPHDWERIDAEDPGFLALCEIEGALLALRRIEKTNPDDRQLTARCRTVAGQLSQSRPALLQSTGVLA